MASQTRFALAPEREAREPPEARGLRRDEVRLLVSVRGTDAIHHTRFDRLPEWLRAGDIAVVNDSATIPAALDARRLDGSTIALHLSTRLPAGLCVVEPRKVAVTAAETLTLPGGGLARLLLPYRDSPRLWIAHLELPEPLMAYLARWGRPIQYPYARGAWPLDMYQTVYASEPGSAEMPSAGRPFTREIIERLRAKGVRVQAITLHTGVASLEAHEPPYDEAFSVPARTADAIAGARKAGGRVIAVGTTVVRALESAAEPDGRIVAARGWTDLVVTPQRGVRAVDALLTGLHEPTASHLAILDSIAGSAHIDRAYAAAIEAGYLWHEFGDLHLIV